MGLIERWILGDPSVPPSFLDDDVCIVSSSTYNILYILYGVFLIISGISSATDKERVSSRGSPITCLLPAPHCARAKATCWRDPGKARAH